jgi:hypothetical protein
MTQPLFDLHGHITVVTGPNQRTGAATACTLSPAAQAYLCRRWGLRIRARFGDPRKVWTQSRRRRAARTRDNRGIRRCDDRRGRSFRIGERYLVYAAGSEQSGFGTGACSRTRRLSHSQTDLVLLRELRAQAVTDAEGWFSIVGLKPDRYTRASGRAAHPHRPCASQRRSRNDSLNVRHRGRVVPDDRCCGRDCRRDRHEHRHQEDYCYEYRDPFCTRSLVSGDRAWKSGENPLTATSSTYTCSPPARPPHRTRRRCRRCLARICRDSGSKRRRSLSMLC